MIASVETGLAPPQPTLRLPKNFVPTSYEARLAIDPSKPTFEGSIKIAGDITERTSVIWLHGRHLTIARAAASQGDPYATPSGTTSLLAVTQHGDDLLELRADPPLDLGKWQLTLEYTGEIDTINTTGAFKETVAGASYVYSQFEAIYARRVFPCVDEPDTKVPWQLTLDIPKGVIAVSNTPVVHTTPIVDGGSRVEFATTKPLPSYLVAFGVGPFDIVDGGKTKSGIPVRMITMHGRGAEAAYAAKSTARVLDLLEEWFGIPYPYEKLDMLTIPVTVGFGAMENAGLVTASETAMLFDPNNPSWAQRHGWVGLISHELAHQWFGDYVTTAWWDDIWLNEGFANWMENKIKARFEPAWHEELVELDMRTSALEADSIISARRIRQPIASTDDILNVFDGITYDKGASVLNMFESYVGADVFQRGVRNYLTARAFGNATSADFVDAISTAAAKDVAPGFASFLDQPGEPDLDVAIACDHGAPRVVISQQRYIPAGSPEPAATQPWIVPVCVAYDHGGKRADACMLLDGPTGTFPLDTKTCPRWLMSNVNGRGYYRTRLTPSQVIALRDEAWPQLTWTERRALAFDVSSSATAFRRDTAAQLPLALALSLIPKMLSGGDRFTIGDALGLPFGVERIVPDDQRPKFEAWLRTTFGPGATKLGALPKPNDDFDAESTRDGLYWMVAWLGRDPALIKQSLDLAAGWHDLPASVRGEILAVAVDASPELFEKILLDVKTEPDRFHRRQMLAALAAVRDPKRIEAALELMLDSPIDFRETERMLFETSTEATRAIAEQFFRAHEAELANRMPQDEVAGGLVGVSRLFTSACDEARRDEIADYVTKHFGALPGGDRVVKQELERMNQCIASRKVLEPQLRGWLGGIKIPKPATTKPATTAAPKKK